MSTTTLEHQPNNILTPMFTRAQNYNYTVSCTKTTNRNAPYCTRKLSTKQLSSDCNSRLPVLAIRAAHSPRIHITTQRNAPKSTTTTNSINQSNKQRIQQTNNQSITSSTNTPRSHPPPETTQSNIKIHRNQSPKELHLDLPLKFTPDETKNELTEA
ncbi:hypothetical protein KC19_1G102100 [Ceratodon purpureus]|uniref:Uncharacterized protein n=1 Tax=Ceratodon purpureus TaxID=3225 RepID=A0A8T0J3G5_CERPU|nr:hypothetical protein KC19_1G102100 [Ceratodon purpureus]